MKRTLLGVLCTIGLAVPLAACDSTATISAPELKLLRMQVLSAVPLVDNAGTLTPSCTVGPDDTVRGFEVGMAFISSAFKPPLTSYCPGTVPVENDLAIRPGDRVERREVLPGKTISPGVLEVAIDCVESYPDDDIRTTRTCDGGAPNPTVELQGIEWRPNYEPRSDPNDIPVRCEPAAVAILIDQSGSMRGLVDSRNGDREDKAGSFPIPSDEERKARASDPFNARLSAAEAFIKGLNANDKFVVFSFQERATDAGLEVVCESDPKPAEGDLANEPEWVRKALECFGVNADIVLKELTQAYGHEEGRTPLWDAVKKAYDFLQREDVDAPTNRHIVVIGDGPDTCAFGSEDNLSDAVPCSEFEYGEVRDHILELNDASDGAPVHVHFVQIQASGYATHDARQQELACLTGGIYSFVNGRDLSLQNDSGVLQKPLNEAMARVRNSISGRWVLQTASPSFDVGPGAAGYLKPGSVFGIGGMLRLKPAEDPTLRLVERQKDNPFDADGASDTGAWDTRLSFRRACAADIQCVAPGTTPNPCMIYCSREQQVCLGTPIAVEDLQLDGTPTACPLGAATGICCEGECKTTCGAGG